MKILVRPLYICLCNNANGMIKCETDIIGDSNTAVYSILLLFDWYFWHMNSSHARWASYYQTVQQILHHKLLKYLFKY